MKKLTYVVSITFEDKIYSDDEIKEVAKNIANSLKEQADHQGLAPDCSDTFTKEISVSSSGLELVNITL